MSPSKSSCSRTRGGLVKGKGIMDPKEGSCSKTRSGLARVNSIVDSYKGSSSRTRSGLVRGNPVKDYNEGSSSRTRSGLVRGTIDMDVNNGSSSRTRSGPVRENIVMGSKEDIVMGSKEDIVMDTNKDSAPKTRSGLVRGNIIMDPNEDSCSRTRSGLVRRKPSVKVETKDEPVNKELPDVCWKADRPEKNGSSQRSDPDFPVIKGPDGSLNNRLNHKTEEAIHQVAKSDHVYYDVRRSYQVHSNGQPVMKGPDGWWKEDIPRKNGSNNKNNLVKAKDELVIKGLPDGWRKEYRPRKTGSIKKTDPYYIDPISGYEFRSLKDVHRYVESGDINTCSFRPTKRNIQDVLITEKQTHTCTSSEHRRPGTADKAIQCELLTSEGTMLPHEELFSPYTENRMPPESEGMKPIQRFANKLDPFKRKSVRPVPAQHAPRKNYVKRKETNAEGKSKKQKTMPDKKVVTPSRASPRLAAHKVGSEGNTERENEPISVNLINQVQSQEKIGGQSQLSPADTVVPIQTSHDDTVNQLQFSQEDSANHKHDMHEYPANYTQLQVDTVDKKTTNHDSTQLQVDTVDKKTTNHGSNTNQLQLSQEDTAVQIQTSHESAVNQLQLSQLDSANHIPAMQEYTTNYPWMREVDSVDKIMTSQENTGNQLQLSQEDTVDEIKSKQETVFNNSQPSQADTVIQIQSKQETIINNSLPSQATAVNQMQLNQENTVSRLQLNQADTVNQVHKDITNRSQLAQALTANQIQTTQGYIANDLQPSQRGAVNYMQINQENIANQHLSQVDSVNQIKTVQKDITNRSQLIKGLTVNQPSQREAVDHMQINQENTAHQLQMRQGDSVNQVQTMPEHTTSRSRLIEGLTVNQIEIIRGNNTRYMQPNYTKSPMMQSVFSLAPDTCFWKNIENQGSSAPMQIDVAPIATSTVNVRCQGPPDPQPVLPTRDEPPGTADYPPGFAPPSLFGNSWSDPCMDFALKTLTSDIPSMDDNLAVTDYFTIQDLNKSAEPDYPDYSAPSYDNTRNHKQVDNVDAPVPRPSDRFYHGGWFPPQ